MKTQISFVFKKGQVEAYNRVIPASKRSRILRQYTINQYQLPNEKQLKKMIKESKDMEKEVYPFHMDEFSLTRLDGFVKQLSEYGSDVSRSLIMRDILEQIIEKYTNNPLSLETKSIKKLFHVPVGTKKKLAQYIADRDRTATFDDFILNEYSGPSLPAKELKKKPKEGSETVMLSLDEDSIEYLDALAEANEVKRAHILRDVVSQLLEKLEKENPIKKSLEYQLKKTISELEQHASADEIMEVISEYKVKKDRKQ